MANTYTTQTWTDGAGGGTPTSAARLAVMETGIQGAWARELGYTQFTAPVTVSATTETTANTVVTAPAITFDGSTIASLEFYSPIGETGTTAADRIVFVLYLDGSSIGFWGQLMTPAALALQAPIKLERRLTPASGSRTYSVRAYKIGTGNGTVHAGAGGLAAYQPGFIRISRA